jgi:hypothetical protein
MPVNEKWPWISTTFGALRDENEWLDALKRYWVNPAVCKNRDIEQFMHKVDLEYVRRLGPRQ